MASDDDKVAPAERVGFVLRLFSRPDIFRTRATIVKYWPFRAVQNGAQGDALVDAERAVEEKSGHFAAGAHCGRVFINRISRDVECSDEHRTTLRSLRPSPAEAAALPETD